MKRATVIVLLLAAAFGSAAIKGVGSREPGVGGPRMDPTAVSPTPDSRLPTPARKQVLYDPNLPMLGTKFHSLPPGKGKSLVEASCFPCHSADMLVQQHLTEKQWTAEVEKMARWGAVMKDSDKPAMIAYLSKSFGPANKFTPVKTRPVGY